MHDITADLARSITWAGSKQSYLTARIVVDKDLVSDFYRAYAYFRWADDIVDGSTRSDSERIAFIRRQTELIDRLYDDDRPGDLTPEEEIVAELISHDSGENSGLQSFIRNMLAVVEFDAYRKGRLISQRELTWYSNRVAKSVTDGIQYFVGNGHPYPTTEGRYLAAFAAHIIHLLRDTLPDTVDGFVNIPREFLEAHDISPEDIDSPPFRTWVQHRVEQARDYFRAGKLYLDDLDVLRCKLAGYWYCARFEGILDAIERDGYVLREVYDERRNLSAWLAPVRLGASLTVGHIARLTTRRT